MSAIFMVKMDMQKAYDSIRWSFVEEIVRALGFLSLFIKWVMECVTTVSYQVNVNGVLTKAFMRRKGLRQGDPMSPRIFV